KSQCNSKRLGIALTAILIIFYTEIGSAQVISGSQIGFFNNGNNQYSANIQQTPTGDLTGVNFAYTPTTLQVTNTATDEESDLYLVQVVDMFSASTIAVNQFPILFTTDHFRPPVSIPLGNFYLGVNTGEGFHSGRPDRSVFGWLELHNDGSTLTAIGNAV